MANINNGLVGFPALQVQALKGTFSSLTGTNANSATNNFSGTNTFSGPFLATGKVTIEGGVLPGSVTLTPAAGAATVCLVSIQVLDGAGVALASSRLIDVWLSDAPTGIGLTATTASGAVGAGASGTDWFTYTAKKALKVQTNAAGLYVLSITDAAKTGFYVCSQIQGAGNFQISAQLIVGNYG